MYGLLNLVSLLTGLAAWALPVVAMVKKTARSIFSEVSFALCALSLLLQIGYTQHLVTICDWSAIEDTHGAVLLAACVLFAGTAMLNTLVALRRH